MLVMPFRSCYLSIRSQHDAYISWNFRYCRGHWKSSRTADHITFWVVSPHCLSVVHILYEEQVYISYEYIGEIKNIWVLYIWIYNLRLRFTQERVGWAPEEREGPQRWSPTMMWGSYLSCLEAAFSVGIWSCIQVTEGSWGHHSWPTFCLYFFF